MKKVLIIDDCQIICDVIQAALEVDGFDCRSCNSGEAAKQLLLENHYTTVFLDVSLPDADSIEIASFIRQRSLISQIVIISGNMNEDVFYQFINLRVNDFFLKNNLSITDLRRVVGEAFWRQERLASLFPEIK